jgi:cytochrome P450
MVRPYAAPRPVEYAPIPDPIDARTASGLALPPGPRGLPGALLPRFLRDTPGFLLGLHHRYGDAASFFLMGELFIAVFTPEAVVDVTVRRQHAFIKGVGFERMRKVLGTGLLTNEEPIHLRHRRMMQPPFHHERLDRFAAQMQRVVRDHLARWPVGGQVSASEELMHLTFRIVADLLFSTDIDRYADGVRHHMGVAIDRIERTMLPGLDRLDAVPLPYFRAFRRSSDHLAAVADDIIEARVRSGERGDDLLGLLLTARDDDDRPMTHDEVRDETLTLILSGHETTANALTWAMAYLRDRDDLWAALAEEARTALPEGEAPTLRRLMAAPVSGAVLAEALRLAPPVWVAPRRAIEDVEVGGVAVPRGAHVLVSQFATHRSPQLFDRPEEFVPQRWLDGLEDRLPRGAYFPFGAGTRKCLGDQFALLEGRIVLLEMARSVRPVPVRKGLPRANPRATYRPAGPVTSRVVAAS